MAFPGEAELISLITPVTDACGLDIEGVKVTRAGRKSVVGIFVDSDIRPDLDLLEQVSQEVSMLLDAAGTAARSTSAPATLEVSTRVSTPRSPPAPLAPQPRPPRRTARGREEVDVARRRLAPDESAWCSCAP